MKPGTPGFCSASRFKDVLAKTRSGESASRQNYLFALVCERLTGSFVESFETEPMRRGAELEKYARLAYEAATDALVDATDSVKHPSIPWVSATPDGLLGESGVLEIKVPNTAQHVEYLLNGFPAKYAPQVYGQLWVTGREFADFVTYDDRLPPELQLGIWRVSRDDKYIANLEKEVIQFLAEVEEMTEKLRNLYKQKETA